MGSLIAFRVCHVLVADLGIWWTDIYIFVHLLCIDLVYANCVLHPVSHSWKALTSPTAIVAQSHGPATRYMLFLYTAHSHTIPGPAMPHRKHSPTLYFIPVIPRCAADQSVIPFRHMFIRDERVLFTICAATMLLNLRLAFELLIPIRLIGRSND
jgi:hypothetical protein